MTPEAPFSPAYSRPSFLETPGGGGVLRRLDDGLGAREPFLLVTGGPGVGKTSIAHEAVARWGSRVSAAFVAYPALTSAEFLEEIVRRFGAEPAEGASRSKLIASVERVLAENTSRGQVSMLVVDDAHDLSTELLGELRLLVNAALQVRRPLEVLLLGLPTLEARLNEPAIAALRQRISVHAKLEPLSFAETRRYLHHRVTAVGGDGPTLFSRKTCREIAARTRGVPRQINTLAAEAMRIAHVWGDQTVGLEHVQTAAASLGGFAPTEAFDGSDDADAQDSSSPAASAPALAEPRAVPPAVPRLVSAAEPRAVPPAEPRPASTTARAASSDEAVGAPPVVPATHDPREWVARFVGDQGPLKLSSRAAPAASWAPEPFSATDPGTEGAGEAPMPPLTWEDRAVPRSRSRHGRAPMLATTAVLAAILVASAVVLILRAGGLARNRAGQQAGVTTSASATQAGDKAASSEKRASSAASRSKSSVAPLASAEEAPPDGATTMSKGPYTLDVGGFRDFDRALEQRDRLQQLTGFEGWVVTTVAGESRPFRVVLGIYRNRQRATAAADMLLNSKTLGYVTVVPLPPRSTRQ